MSINYKYYFTCEQKYISFLASKYQEDVYIFYIEYTRCFKYDWDYLCVNLATSVPVIFEPPCIF